MRKGKYNFGCFSTAIILAVIVSLLFVIIVGGPAAVDKAYDKLVEYKDTAYNKVAEALNIQNAEKDTTKAITNVGIIGDTLPNKKPLNTEDNNVIKIKLDIQNNMMFIRPKINGIEMRFLLDTGCADIHLTPVEVFFMEHQGVFNAKKSVGIEKCVYADGQEHDCAAYILNSVELAGIKIDSIKCTVDYNGDDANNTPLLGQNVLRKFGDITINYGDSILIIKKK